MRLEEYLWHDALHPTAGVHEAMGAEIARMLEGGEDVGARGRGRGGGNEQRRR